MNVQPVDESVLMGSFAKAVSELADGTKEELDACLDRDLRECAAMLRAARRVAQLHFRARNEAGR